MKQYLTYFVRLYNLVIKPKKDRMGKWQAMNINSQVRSSTVETKLSLSQNARLL